jgi:hypothetical protein
MLPRSRRDRAERSSSFLDTDEHVAVEQEAQLTVHSLLLDALLAGQGGADANGEVFIEGYRLVSIVSGAFAEETADLARAAPECIADSAASPEPFTTSRTARSAAARTSSVSNWMKMARFESGPHENDDMLPLYRDSWFTFPFGEDRIVPRFHLEGVKAGQRVCVFKIDADTRRRLGLLATATVGEDGWLISLSRSSFGRARRSLRCRSRICRPCCYSLTNSPFAASMQALPFRPG